MFCKEDFNLSFPSLPLSHSLTQGDTQIRLFEIVDEPPYCHFLNMVQFKDPMRGMGCMPKRELNYMKCEVMRFFKLLNKGIVEPVSMTVPRKVCCCMPAGRVFSLTHNLQHIDPVYSSPCKS